MELINLIPSNEDRMVLASVGEFKIKVKAAFKFNESINYLIDINLHATKTSTSRAVLTGNINNKIPFDDSLNSNVNMAVLSKIGGWKSNAFVYSTKNACSISKKLLGEGWNFTMNHLNISDYDCPVKLGNYKMTNLDPIEVFERTVLKAKQFFYGSYKINLFFTKKSGFEVGSFVIILDILRPWED
ncbi:uncharacterized protein LOC126902211 isoform X2 [Daktulosphaira vitifoliae]|uniref:uncharacterized protein LOC126902211 isoform X2 n=1 Tax=Daktulosphaira vitifoliae TaxID=58002 RepID=UPI0021AACC03|nr:uncharacterized protein LOC126902211 isoform X2 [Daktulosphaira vitifoliae]